MATESESRPAPSEEASTETTRERRRRPFWREFPVLLVIAFAVALLIKTFLVQAFWIPSLSMLPTLERGDRVLVEKVTYRFGSPGPGDVVVFERQSPARSESDDSFWTGIVDAFRGLFGFPTGGEEDLIKRVIGVEGDTIEARDGRVYVNDEPLPEPYLGDGIETSTFGPVTVRSGEVFVMGDNRGDSEDSRVFGPVLEEDVVGHAFLLIWPPGDVGTL